MTNTTARGGISPAGGPRRPKASRTNRETNGAAISKLGPHLLQSLLTDTIESEEKARKQDLKRIKRLTIAASLRYPMNWSAPSDKFRLLRRWPHGLPTPPIDHDALDRLKAKLEQAVETRFTPSTGASLSVASSIRMRSIRLQLFTALFVALEHYPNEDLRTFTIVNSRWRVTPSQLDQLDAARLARRLRADLTRTCVFDVEGPLVAFLHGEFEPVTGTFQLHFHGVTTAGKAEALKCGLKTIAGYRKTFTGASGVRVDKVRHRVRQLTYLLKAYWLSKGYRRAANGENKRDKKGQRIPEPFGTQVLLWLDRHRVRDLTLMNDVWSRRKGGPAAMREFYLSVREWV